MFEMIEFGDLVLKLAIVIGAAAIIGVGFFGLQGALSTSNPNAKLPKFQNSGEQMPSSFANAVSNPSLALSRMVELVANQSKNISQLSVSYSGQAYVNSPAIPFISSFSSPIALNITKYYNDSSTSIYGSLPVVGSVGMQFSKLDNESYLCANINLTAINSGKPQAVLSGPKSWSCVQTESSAGINLNALSNFDLTALGSYGLMATYNTSYQTYYKGMPCTYIEESLSEIASNGTQIGNGKAGMCISNYYYVPLSFALYFNKQKNFVSLVMNETTIEEAAPQGISLPGPVIQTTTSP